MGKEENSFSYFEDKHKDLKKMNLSLVNDKIVEVGWKV